MTGRRSIRRTRRLPIGLAAAMLASLLQVVAGPAAHSQSSTSSCTQAPPDADYLLPPWSDSAGWKNPDQYETIVSGDIDGDGIGELVGRNAAALETWTWDRSYGTTNPDGTPNKAYDPVPGQWIQILPQAKPAVDFLTENGWWDPSRYSTFRLADVDPQRKGDELIFRWTTGLYVLTWDTTNNIWAPLVRETGVFDDTDGFGQSNPATYTTITTGNVDGQPGEEILGRSSDGLQTWQLNSAGTALTRLDQNSTLFAGPNWSAEDRWYSSIRVGDVNGDGRDEVLGRDSEGLHAWDLDGAGGTWTKLAGDLLEWGDGPSKWGNRDTATISVGDVNGDKREDVLSLAPNGIDAYQLVSGSWEQIAPPGGFTADLAPWTAFQFMADPDFANNGVIARRADGLHRAILGTSVQGEPKWELADIARAEFSDDHFGPLPTSAGPADLFHGTIRPVTTEAGTTQLVIGRESTGIRTTTIPDVGNIGVPSPSSPFPFYTDLTGIPIGLDTPPAQLPSSPEGRAYWYINAKAHQSFWQGSPGDQTILKQYRDTAEQTNLGSLNSILAKGGFDPGQDQALNVPRATYNKVNKDVNDWTTAVTTLYGHLLDGDGVKQLIEDVFVTNAGAVGTIKAAFEETDDLDVLVGDLLAAFIALLGTVDFGLSDVAAAALAGAASLAGAGVSGGFGFLNPNGAIDSTADTLQSDMVNSFCVASAFVDQSFDQAVQDYGLLTTSARMVERSPSLATTYDQSKAAMVRGQKLWIWQQFGNQSFTLGWCDYEHWDTCLLDDAITWTPPENPQIHYSLFLDHCDDGFFDPENDAKWAPFNALNPSRQAITSPRQTDIPYDGSDDSDTGPGTPPEGLNEGTIGILGWHLNVEECSRF